jgi:hypothetical protein
MLGPKHRLSHQSWKTNWILPPLVFHFLDLWTDWAYIDALLICHVFGGFFNLLSAIGWIPDAVWNVITKFIFKVVAVFKLENLLFIFRICVWTWVYDIEFQFPLWIIFNNQIFRCWPSTKGLLLTRSALFPSFTSERRCLLSSDLWFRGYLQ